MAGLMRRGVLAAVARAVRPQVAAPAWAAQRLQPFLTNASAEATPEGLLKTKLWDMHVANGGKMVDFAGWSMPIQYKDSIMEATQWCRTKASLFDVSHMCGLTLKGKDAVDFLESLVVGDIKGLADGTGSLSVFTNEKGGIIDDTVITKINDEHIYLVLNAGCRQKDLTHIKAHLDAWQGKGKDVTWHIHDENAILAFQGPKAVEVLQGMVKDDLSKLYFGMYKGDMQINGVKCMVTRTGYTGEDGFELAIPNTDVVSIVTALTKNADVRFCALGARDSLRLEAGLCLYGNDLDETKTPVEGGLTWTVGKRRREKFDFLGGDVIKQQIADGVTQRRVGFLTTGAPARNGSELLDGDGNVIGMITSGGFSPCLSKNIAMGYIDKPFAKAGTEVKVKVRAKVNDAVVTKMPFIPVTYHKP